MQLFGVPVEFILFAPTLVGVALLHHYTLYVALAGLAVIAGYKLAFTGFKVGAGFAGLTLRRGSRWPICMGKRSRSACGCVTVGTSPSPVIGFFVMLAILGWNPDPRTATAPIFMGSKRHLARPLLRFVTGASGR